MFGLKININVIKIAYAIQYVIKNFEYKNFLNLSNPMINKRIPDIAYPIQEKGIS